MSIMDRHHLRAWAALSMLVLLGLALFLVGSGRRDARDMDVLPSMSPSIPAHSSPSESEPHYTQGEAGRAGQSPRSPSAIGGILELEDGLALEDWPLSIARSEAPELDAPGALIEGRTDADGRFHFAPLAEGNYQVQDRSSASLGASVGTVAAGELDARVRFPFYRIRILGLAATGSPLEGASLHFEFAPSETGARQQTRTVRTSGEGVADWYVRSEGAIQVVGVSADGFFRSDPLSIAVRPGVSFLTHKLTLFPVELSARMTIRVDCLGSGSQSPFLVQLVDPRTESVLRVFQPEEATSEGKFEGLPVGTFRLVLRDRYRSPFGMYLGDRISQDVELMPHETTDVTFLARCGGRLQITLLDPPGTAAAAPTLAALVSQREQRKLAVFYIGEDGLAHGSYRIPTGRTVTSEEVLRPGTYELLLTRADEEPVRLPIAIVSGEVTEVSVEMGRR